MHGSTARIAEAAMQLREELESQRLVVAKTHGYPRPRRTAVEQNAHWYREFCAEHKRRRRRYPRPRTIIKRCMTLAALDRIADGARTGVYVGRLLPIVERRAARRRPWKPDPKWKDVEF